MKVGLFKAKKYISFDTIRRYCGWCFFTEKYVMFAELIAHCELLCTIVYSGET